MFNYPFITKHRTHKAIDSWVKEGIISHEQANLLYVKYEIDSSESLEEPWYTSSTFIVSVLGIVLVSMGIILLISRNWEEFPVYIRSLFCLLPLLGAYAGGIYFWQKKPFDKSRAELSFFLASILFGINIYSQAQIFHISSYYPNGLLAWLVGCLPFTFIFRGNLFAILTQVLFFYWIIALYPQYDFHWLSLPIILLFIYQFFKNANPVTQTLTVGNVFLYILFIEFIFVKGNENVIFENISLFLLFGVHLIIASFLINSTTLKALFRYFPSLLLPLIINTYFFTFKWKGSYNMENGFPFIVLISLFILVAAGVFVFNKKQFLSFANWRNNLPIWYIYAFTGILLLNQVFRIWLWKPDIFETQIIMSLFTNFFILIAGVGFIRYGILIREKWAFLSGIGALALLALIRFIDYFDDFTTSAIIFMLTGAAIIWINRYWNKNIAQQSNKEIPSENP